MYGNSQESLISSAIVTNSDGFCESKLGNQAQLFENFIYKLTDMFVGIYSKEWKFCQLSNGGFYMQMHKSQDVNFTNIFYNFSEQINPDTASIIINLNAFELLSESGIIMEMNYHLLEEFAMQSDNWRVISKMLY